MSAVLIALWCGLPAASYLDRWGLVEDPWAAPAAFLILLVLGRVLLDAVVRRWVAFSPRVAGSNVLDRSMGALPGAVTGLVNAAVVAMVLLAAPVGNGMKKSAQSSTLAVRLAAPADWIEAKLAPIFEPAISRAISKFTVQPQEDVAIELPFVVTDPTPRPDLEAAMLVLLNAERRKHGCNAFVMGIGHGHRSTAACGTGFPVPRIKRWAACRSRERVCKWRHTPRLKMLSYLAPVNVGERSIERFGLWVVNPPNAPAFTLWQRGGFRIAQREHAPLVADALQLMPLPA
ncbi:CvpA family protein [Variovorax sp. MHTC-1]|uniref:CvpA family protein n=1 Tax=Variovorax sp. MHTC-1 TaxID=2495593 RepID=UPI000F893665|nr:CvpA family protein [Variovorax sp. MHTC-1]RST50142.1 CvpA family protein [Variovorax sp. MHTC-1]